MHPGLDRRPDLGGRHGLLLHPSPAGLGYFLGQGLPEVGVVRQVPEERQEIGPPQGLTELGEGPAPLEQVDPEGVSYSTVSEDEGVERPEFPRSISDFAQTWSISLRCRGVSFAIASRSAFPRLK